VTDSVALCWALLPGGVEMAGLFRLLSECAVISMKRKKFEEGERKQDSSKGTDVTYCSLHLQKP
jgi:hypothetical protein